MGYMVTGNNPSTNQPLGLMDYAKLNLPENPYPRRDTLEQNYAIFRLKTEEKSRLYLERARIEENNQNIIQSYKWWNTILPDDDDEEEKNEATSRYHHKLKKRISRPAVAKTSTDYDLAVDASTNPRFKNLILPASAANDTLSNRIEDHTLQSMQMDVDHFHNQDIDRMCIDARPITRVIQHGSFASIELVPAKDVQLVDYSRDSSGNTMACTARMARFEPVGRKSSHTNPSYTTAESIKRRMLRTFTNSEECWRFLESARDGVSILLNGIVLLRQNGQFITFVSNVRPGVSLEEDIFAWPAILLDTQHILKLNIDGELEGSYLSDVLIWILRRGYSAYGMDGLEEALELEPPLLLTWYRRLDHIVPSLDDITDNEYWQNMNSLKHTIHELCRRFIRLCRSIMNSSGSVNLYEIVNASFNYDDENARRMGLDTATTLRNNVIELLNPFFATETIHGLCALLERPWNAHDAFSSEFIASSTNVINCGGRHESALQDVTIDDVEQLLSSEMNDSESKVLEAFPHLQFSEERNRSRIGYRSSRGIAEGVESCLGLSPSNILFLPTRSPSLSRIYVQFSELKGMALGFVIDTKLLARCQQETVISDTGALMTSFTVRGLVENMEKKEEEQKKVHALARRMITWIRTVLVSPLSVPVIETICSLLFSAEVNMHVLRQESQRDENMEVVLYRLSTVCPVAAIKEILKQNALRFSQSESTRELVEDRAGYNIHRVWRSSTRDYEKELRMIGRMALFDLTDRLTTNSLDDNDLYLKIQDKFYGGYVFVYIRGLRYGISDKLLKLLAEWTKDCPWCGVYLEDTPLEDNLPENVDRVVKRAATSSGEIHSDDQMMNERSNVYEMRFLPQGETHVDSSDRDTAHSNISLQQVVCEKFPPIYAGIAARNINTNWEGKWQKLVTEKLQPENILQNDVLHIEGIPGVGKTVLMTELMGLGHIKNNYVAVDCSSDILVIRPMVEYLGSRVSIHENATSSNENFFIIFADEYHMLTSDQKKQLIGFSRAKGCILIMVSNRLDITDRHIMSAIMQLEDNNAQARIIRCRGMLNTMLFHYVLLPVLEPISDQLRVEARDLLQRDLDAVEEENFQRYLVPEFDNHASLNSKKRYIFFHLWFSVMRQLFGEESMTHRIVNLSLNPLLKGDNNIIVSPDKNRKNMANLISETNPGIPHSFSLELCKVLIRIFREDCEQVDKFECSQVDQVIRKHKSRSFLKDINSGAADVKSRLAEMLVRTALLGDFQCQSFPEFSIHAAKNSHRFHVVRKLVSYIQYMHERAGVEFTKGDIEECGNLLLRFHILDKPTRFPAIMMDSGVQLNSRDMTHVEVVCNYVDLSDLEAMRGTYVRGQAINLDAARENWKSHPITDYEGFMKLVPLFPPILTAVSDDNLFTLLMTNENDPTLAQYVVHHRRQQQHQHHHPIVENAEHSSFSDPKNAYYFAAWLLYKHQELDSNSTHFKRLENSSVLDFQVFVFNTAVTINKLNLLRWAGRYASSAMRLPRKDVLCAQFLEAMLADMVQLTVTIMEENSYFVDATAEERQTLKEVFELWTRQFASLTRVGKAFGGLPVETAMVLARNQYPSHPEWPPAMRILSAMNFTRLKSEEMRVLYVFDQETNNEFWNAVLKNQGTNHSKEVLKHICTSPLSMEWQRKIIETENLELPSAIVKSHHILAFAPYLRTRTSVLAGSAAMKQDIDATVESIIKVKKTSTLFRSLKSLLQKLVPI